MRTLLYAGVVGLTLLVGCDNGWNTRNTLSDSASQAAQRDRDREVYKEQAKKMDEQIARADVHLDFADRQMKKMQEQNERYDTILNKWDAQAQRFDRILDRWEEIVAEIDKENKTG